MRNTLVGLILICNFSFGFSQDKKDIPTHLGNPMIVDSSFSSNLIIPIVYKPRIGFERIELRNDHYADILFYNTKSDSVKRLFNKNTFIKPFQLDYIPVYSYHSSVYSSKWIFYFVKTSDYNNDGQIDLYDPYTLYVSDKNGNGLMPITQLNENALSIDIYDKQGFALIKLQKDTNGDKKFGNNEWADFYYVRLDLSTLSIKRQIDMTF